MDSRIESQDGHGDIVDVVDVVLRLGKMPIQATVEKAHINRRSVNDRETTSAMHRECNSTVRTSISCTGNVATVPKEILDEEFDECGMMQPNMLKRANS